MRWEPIEFVLKGVYLGLLLMIALPHEGMEQPLQWWQVGLIGVITLGMLVLCLGVAAVQKLREGYRVRGRVPGFILFLILENPILVYTGVIGGLALGAYYIIFRDIDEEWTSMLP